MICKLLLVASLAFSTVAPSDATAQRPVRVGNVERSILYDRERSTRRDRQEQSARRNERQIERYRERRDDARRDWLYDLDDRVMDSIDEDDCCD